MVAQKRIIGGQTASFGELPWQAHIRISGFQCGGVLVNHYYVATAGKLMIKLVEITVELTLTRFTNYCHFHSTTFAHTIF